VVVAWKRFALTIAFAREAQLQKRGRALQRNFPAPAGVVARVMLTSAIVFGMVGVAAGFTWEYLVKREE
jgi:hypothetical protein